MISDVFELERWHERWNDEMLRSGDPVLALEKAEEKWYAGRASPPSVNTHAVTIPKRDLWNIKLYNHFREDNGYYAVDKVSGDVIYLGDITPYPKTYSIKGDLWQKGMIRATGATVYV